MEAPLLIFPETIDLATSLEVMSHSLQHGSDSPIVLNGETKFIWKSFIFRRPILTDELQAQFQKYKRTPTYWLRSRADLEWEWVETPITKKIQELISSLDKYIVKLTRVQTLVLLANNELPGHCDKVAGTLYKNDPCLFGLGYEEENNFHHDNKYFALKIPLFSENGFGRPYIEMEDGKVLEYDPQGHVFAINEVEIKHGAFSVDYPRGVIVMDAILDMEQLRKFSRSY